LCYTHPKWGENDKLFEKTVAMNLLSKEEGASRREKQEEGLEIDKNSRPRGSQG
jgi:hypothetical protein